MIAAVLGALAAHWRRRPLQLVTLLGGLVLATALWSGVQALNAEARASYAASATALGQSAPDRLVPSPGARITKAEFAALRRKGWLVSPVVEGTLPGGVRIIGIDALTSPPRPGLAAVADGRVALADLLGAPGVLLAAPETDLRPGLPPTVAVAEVPRGEALTDVATAQRLLGLDGYDHLLILPDQPLGRPGLGQVTDLRRVAGEDNSDIAALTRSFHLNLTAFGLLSFAVGLFIVQSAIGLAFEQRRGTVRTLRAMGVPLRVVLGAIAAELAVLALVGGAVGLMLGYALAGALMPGVTGTLQGLYGARVDGTLAFDPLWAVAGLAMTAAGVALAAAQAMLRTARLPLLASAEGGAWAAAAARTIRWQALAAAVLIALACLLALTGGSLALGFACLAALLLGAALALPGVLSLGLKALARVTPPGLWHWAVADTRQQVPGLSLALMALLLALAANVGVSTMVGSFRGTFLGWLDQRLAAELYVTAQSQSGADALSAALEAEPRVDAVLPIWSVEIPLGAVRGEAYGIVPDPLYSENWPLVARTPGLWDRLHRGEGILVNEQMYRREGLTLGQTIEVLPGWRPEVLGAYSDYGNTRPQIMVDSAALAAQVQKPTVLRYALRVAPEDAADVRRDLIARLGLPPGNVVDQAQVKALSVEVFERTFLITGALNVLTLAVAGFALLMSLLTLADLRLPQIAPVWAIGIETRRLAWMDVARTAALAAATWVLAIPVGLALAWVLLAIVNVQAFGWRLPMMLFPADWLWLGLWALVATLIAAAWPAWSLARGGAFGVLRVFSRDA